MSWKQKKINASELARLYNDMLYSWLLLEVLKKKNGKAEWFYFIKAAKTKDELSDYIMDEDDNWDWSKEYIFVYADPNSLCEL